MENWLKLVSIWSVFWVKVSIFEKVPTHFSKCVFLDYRIFDKCDFIYAKMAKNDTFLAKNDQKIFSQKTGLLKLDCTVGLDKFWKPGISQ